MAHFARLNKETNEVIDVVVINNNDIKDSDGIEQETIGIELCKSLWGDTYKYVQTSYSGSFRGCFAGTGYIYDELNGVFIAPK